MFESKHYYEREDYLEIYQQTIQQMEITMATGKPYDDTPLGDDAYPRLKQYAQNVVNFEKLIAGTGPAVEVARKVEVCAIAGRATGGQMKTSVANTVLPTSTITSHGR